MENKRSAVYYTLEKINDNKTKMTIDLYLKNNFIAQLLFNISMKGKIEARFQRSLANLEELLKEIELPVEF